MTTSNLTADKETLVSIILPVFNRQNFIRDAIKAIREQTFKQWELIIVDDGSTDSSLKLSASATADIEQNVVLLSQNNGGAASARILGLSKSNADLIAFYDSDDIWLPHHLTDCIRILSSHHEISWVYGACKRVHYLTKEVEATSTFYTNGQRNKLFSSATKHSDGTYIVDKKNALCNQLSKGLDCGLQNSVFKRQVLNTITFPDFRIGEDWLLITMAIKAGFKFAFLDNIHVIYQIHEGNVSDTNNASTDFERRIISIKSFLATKEKLCDLVELSQSEERLHKRKLADELFWVLGYSLQQKNGDYQGALRSYMSAIGLNPFDPKYYKTSLVTFARFIYYSVVR